MTLMAFQRQCSHCVCVFSHWSSSVVTRSLSSVPKGLEDVSKYPALFAELLRRGYSDNDVAKISRLNIIRVLQKAEEVRDNR